MMVERWICHYHYEAWAFGETPQKAYDTLCENEGEDIAPDDCTFYKMQNVRFTIPTRYIIEEVI